jgi:hypothetical protein
VPRGRLLAVPLLLALAAGVAACGGSKHAADVTTPPLGAASAPAGTATAPATGTTPAAPAPATTTAPRTTATTTAPSRTTTTTSSPQGTGGAQAGCDGSVAGGFIRGVQAGGTDCARARDVASAWFAAVHGGAAPDSRISAAGYACAATMTGERASVACSAADGSKVAFTASP